MSLDIGEVRNKSEKNEHSLNTAQYVSERDLSFAQLRKKTKNNTSHLEMRPPISGFRNDQYETQNHKNSDGTQHSDESLQQNVANKDESKQNIEKHVRFVDKQDLSTFDTLPKKGTYEEQQKCSFNQRIVFFLIGLLIGCLLMYFVNYSKRHQ